jgi:hypothetical protein
MKKQNEIIGELIIQEKYKFVDKYLISEIVKDTLKELEN